MFRGRTGQTQSRQPAVLFILPALSVVEVFVQVSGVRYSSRQDMNVKLPVLCFSSEQRRRRGSERNMWRRDSCRGAQVRLVNHLRPHLCEHKRCWAQRSILIGRSDRRPRSVSGGEKDDPGLRLYHAALAGDLVAMAAALAQGAEVNGSIGEEEGRTALIGAAVGVRRYTERRGVIDDQSLDWLSDPRQRILGIQSSLKRNI